ncbi:MAG: polysaccharide biosynthesis C-terminal domain-containing protein [Nitrososphaerota archaeon]
MVALFILLAGGIVTTILFWFGAGFLVRLAGGREFAEATLALKILSLGFVLFYLSALTMWLLVVFDKQFWLIVVYGVGSVFNLLINLALIPTFGYLAAAVTTGLSELVIFVMSALLVVRFFRSLFRINNKW